MCRTEDPEHDADLDLCEEDVGWTERVLESVVNVLMQSTHVVRMIVVGVVHPLTPSARPSAWCSLVVVVGVVKESR